MGIVESIPRNWRVAIASGFIVAIAAAIMTTMLESKQGPAPATGISGKQAWFSTDDGKTWFADEVTKVPPFMRDGKQAYRAYVYRASDGTTFVSHLERYTPAGQREVAAASAQQSTNPLREPAHVLGDKLEVKKPGQSHWTNSSDPRAAEVRRAVSPKGESAGLQPVYPD